MTDALKTFYLQVYSVKHMIKDHSDTERRNRLLLHMGYSFFININFVFYMHHSLGKIVCITAFVISDEHWLEQEMGPP